MTPVLRRFVGPVTKRRISRFGIELECLTPEDKGGGTEETEVEHECDCQHCTTQYDYEEVERETSEAWVAFMHTFHDAGLIVSRDELCDYHCSCRHCCYDREDFPLMAAQEDGTVGVEFVSRILDATKPYDVEQVDALIDTYRRAQARSGWVADGYTDNGNHIHVSKWGDDDGTSRRFRYQTVDQAWYLAQSLFAVGRWSGVAAGGCGRLRTYNGTTWAKNGTDGVLAANRSTSWMGSKSDTTEYRLWNTPATPERIKAHVGLSIGIQRWSICQVITQRERLAEMRQGEFEEIISANFAEVAAVILDAVPDKFRDESAKALELWEPA